MSQNGTVSHPVRLRSANRHCIILCIFEKLRADNNYYDFRGWHWNRSEEIPTGPPKEKINSTESMESAMPFALVEELKLAPVLARREARVKAARAATRFPATSSR